MGAVNSYSDIPGGVVDRGACSMYQQECLDRKTLINGDYLPAANNLKTIVDLCNGYAKDGKISIDQGKTSFEDGAYYDGVTDFVQQLTDASEAFTNVTADMDELSSNLATLIAELEADAAFCEDRADTWMNAITFLDLEERKRMMGQY